MNRNTEKKRATKTKAEREAKAFAQRPAGPTRNLSYCVDYR